MKNMTFRLALLIVCALSINTAFAQDVRQKPVVKKQTTTTKQTTSAPKKQNKSVAKKNSSPVRNVQLKDLLTNPLGIVDIDFQNCNIPFSDIEAELKQKYVAHDKQSKAGESGSFYDFDNPSFKNIYYHGIRLSSFSINNSSYDKKGVRYCRSMTYHFEIYKYEMKQSLSKYLKAIENDFHKLGIPVSIERGSDGDINTEIRVGNIKYEIEIFESVYYWIWIKEYIYK